LNRFAVITPIPILIETFIQCSIIRKAINKKIVEIRIVDLREYGIGNYKQIDDTPFGGGSGMIMMPEPLSSAIDDMISWMGRERIKVLYPSPQGQVWNQKRAVKFGNEKNIIIICGHYKGIDERVIEKYVTDEFSIGNFIMTNGEIPSMTILDSIIRLIPGTLNNIDSALTDSFSNQLLDHPHYTQPRVFQDMAVPDVLLNGNHKKINSWRKNQREIQTKVKRPDLWNKYVNMKESGEK
tara:strand:+ start:3184 stop:3900 length:717 start_codon:yes stop_codon:yes gene_type:complete